MKPRKVKRIKRYESDHKLGFADSRAAARRVTTG